jgi:hypothetical protein
MARGRMGNDPGGMKLGNHRPSYQDLHHQLDLHLLKQLILNVWIEYMSVVSNQIFLPVRISCR